MTRSTFYDEDLGEVLDLSGHGTWANTDLCEISQDLVDALSPLQTISKGHEERVAALEAVQKTAQEQADLENESDRKQLRDDAVAIASHTQEALAARVLAVEISLASSSPSADVGEETSWLSSVSARLESIEFWIATMWNNSDRELTASIMDRLRALETSHASSGKSMDDREPALSASQEDVDCSRGLERACMVGDRARTAAVSGSLAGRLVEV